jgi:hypothetical protein
MIADPKDVLTAEPTVFAEKWDGVEQREKQSKQGWVLAFRTKQMDR